jgi:hypothetical protein
VRRDTMKTVEEKEEAAVMTAAPVGAGSRA